MIQNGDVCRFIEKNGKRLLLLLLDIHDAAQYGNKRIVECTDGLGHHRDHSQRFSVGLARYVAY